MHQRLTDLDLSIEKNVPALKAHNQFTRSRRTDTFVRPLELVRKADLSRPMLTLSPSHQDQVLSNLPGQLHVWAGWPMFDVRFVNLSLTNG